MRKKIQDQNQVLSLAAYWPRKHSHWKVVWGYAALQSGPFSGHLLDPETHYFNFFPAPEITPPFPLPFVTNFCIFKLIFCWFWLSSWDTKFNRNLYRDPSFKPKKKKYILLSPSYHYLLLSERELGSQVLEKVHNMRLQWSVVGGGGEEGGTIFFYSLFSFFFFFFQKIKTPQLQRNIIIRSTILMEHQMVCLCMVIIVLLCGALATSNSYFHSGLLQLTM